MNYIQLITFTHCVTARILYVFPTVVLTEIRSELKEEWLWERPSQSIRHCRDLGSGGYYWCVLVSPWTVHVSIHVSMLFISSLLISTYVYVSLIE